MKQSGDMNLKFPAECCGFSGSGIENAASGNKSKFTSGASKINSNAKQGPLIENDPSKKGSLVSGVGPMNSMADSRTLIQKY